MRRCTLVLVLTVLSAGPAAAEVIDRVVAVVDAQVITLSDVRAAQAFGLARTSPAGNATADVVAYLIDRLLMLGEVDRYSAAEPDRAALDRRLAEIRSAFSTAADFERTLKRTAMTEGRLRSLVSDTLRVDLYIDQRFGGAAQPTPDEVQRYYRDHPGEFTRDGKLVPFDDAQSRARDKVVAERRKTLVAGWLDRLRRRAQVAILYPAPVREPEPGRNVAAPPAFPGRSPEADVNGRR